MTPRPQPRPRLVWLSLLAAGVLGAACGAPAATAASPASPPTTSQGGPTAAEQAAMYALPLVIMDLTREHFFADPIAVDATPNRFLHIPVLGNPTFRSVVRPNVDTLYSTAWVDLTAEPVLLTVPPSDGRYYMVQCMDAWTNVFAAPGIRTLGNQRKTFALVGPGWQGKLPDGVEAVRVPTRMGWVLGRIYVRDAADLGAARVFQRQLDLRPMSGINDASYAGVYPRPRDPNAQPRKIMRDLLRDMDPAAFYERFSNLTSANPPAPADAPFIARVLQPLGLTPGMPITWALFDDARRSALRDGLAHVLAAFENRAQQQRHNMMAPTGWTSLGAAASQGDYGTNYQARAAVALIGLGANLRADAVYMNAAIDAAHQPLDGGKRYRLRFAAGQTPPVHAFWSVTLYDEQGYLIANPIERYAIKSGDEVPREADGSLVILLQPDDPGTARHAAWLPTPAHQRFELSLRAYWPDAALLDGRWLPPAVEPVPR